MTGRTLLGLAGIIGFVAAPTVFSEQSAPLRSGQHQIVKPGDIKW